MNVSYTRNVAQSLKPRLWILCCGFLIIGFDQLIKYWTALIMPSLIVSHEGFPVFKDVLGVSFSIDYVTNTGAAWGFLQEHQLILVGVRLVLIVAMLIYLFFFNTLLAWQMPLIWIISGATSNVIDFFTYGHVVDMLHFVLWGYDFAVFNLADSAISIGIGWLFLISWLKK